MPDRPDIAYLYDGSFPGFFCCVFESFLRKEIPAAILAYEEPQGILYGTRDIETDMEKAKRVMRSIPRKISGEAMGLVRLSFLSCMEERELRILRFLRLGYQIGPRVTGMLTHDAVAPLERAARYVLNEREKYLGFVRFSDYDGALVSVIEPQNNLLPLLKNHFCDRLSGETFLIYDKTHRQALLHQKGQSGILPLDSLDLPDTGREELAFRALWRRFYDTVAVEGRINSKGRMTHMPKRYWNRLTEFQTDAPVQRTLPEEPG